MIVYSASITFHKNEECIHYPCFCTEKAYSDINNFLDYCELTARENKMFSTSNVSIACLKIEIVENGLSRKLEFKRRCFLNKKKSLTTKKG